MKHPAILPLVALLALALFTGRSAQAQTPAPAPAPAQNAQGLFTLTPSDGPSVALEAVDSGSSDGTAVSLGVKMGASSQKWELVPKGDNLYVIKPSYSPTLVLDSKGGGSDDGTPLVLSTEKDSPSQMWQLKTNDADGSFSIIQKGSGKAVDDLGGNKTPGARVDVWEFNSDDPHVQWTLTPLDGATAPKLAVPILAGSPGGPQNPAYPPVVPLPKNDIPPGAPEGKVTNFVYDQSKIFPGTKRNVSVFVPAQYDGSQPACVYVEQDGYNPGIQKMIEGLIAAKDMPVTIGVFISSGTLPSPVKGSVDRRNRCYEYDGVSDNYVRFLTEELLPYVAQTYNLKMSTDGKDRCIAGASSGGISSFTAAWHHPEAFSRVYACSGSWSAFRDGNEFPILVLKTEAKPIRAFLTTATKDMENCAGNWFLFDQEMAKALTFSGYDYQLVVSEGGHCTGWPNYFPVAMRYLWKDWPAPITPGPSAPRVRDLIDGVNTWQPAGQGYVDARSPAVNSKGEIFFVDTGRNKIFKIGTDGKIGVFVDDAAQANGLAVGPKDELYTVSNVTGKVMTYDASGQGTVVVDGLPGNYVLARPDGSLYVTSNKLGQPATIWYVQGGNKTQVDTGLKFATGMAIRPDQWLLTVADGATKWVYSYQMNNDGTLINKEPFFHSQVQDADDDAGTESLCYAAENRLLSGTRSGVQMFADDGPVQAIIPVPAGSRVIGVALGGPTMTTLYAFCGDKIWSRVVKVHATGAFSNVIPQKGNPL